MKRIPNLPKKTLITLEDCDGDIFELERFGQANSRCEPTVAIRCNNTEIRVLQADLNVFIEALKELQ